MDIFGYCKRGYIDKVKQLLDSGTKVTVEDLYEHTLLHIAAMEGHPSLCQLLIQKGLNVDLCDEKGKTALHYATLYGHSDICQLLIQSGADLNIQNICPYAQTGGETPLHMAIWDNRFEISQILVKAGADVNKLDDSGFPPLFMAIKYGNENIYHLLRNKGAKIDIESYYGCTPLHIASMNFQLKMITILLKEGIDINILNKSEETPLFSVMEDYYKMVEKKSINTCCFLLEKGANPLLGKTPHFWKLQSINQKLATLLSMWDFYPDIKYSKKNKKCLLDEYNCRQKQKKKTLYLFFPSDLVSFITLY